MEKTAQELDFISQIKRDGSGTVPVTDERKRYLSDQNETFTIKCLSATFSTYIASGFNSYVVKLKEDK